LNIKVNADQNLYVVLYNDYDCQPYQTINYNYGLAIRNLYFIGSLSQKKFKNGYTINYTYGGGDDSAKRYIISSRCDYVDDDAEFSDRRCKNRI
jgi:hypothetical protein